MKRNTRYNPERASLLADIFVVVVSLCVIAYTSFLFYRNLNKTFERKDKTPVALVSFKYKSVQRRFLDRAVWDRPVQYSPVYNGDTLRTAPDAEAVVHFPDKSVISIDSNTMIQIFKPLSEEASVQIAEGRVSVQTAGSKMTVKSAGASVSIEKDSILHADKKAAGSLRLAVQKGTAALTKNADEDKAGGTTVSRMITEGTASDDDEAPFVSILSPVSGTKMLNQNAAGANIPVLFKWHSTFSADTELVLETSRSRGFTHNVNRISVTGLEELTVEEPSGTLYWRLYAADTGFDDDSADSGKLSILEAPPPSLLQPADEDRYAYRKRLPALRFLWKGSALASSYTLEIADNPDMLNPAAVKQVSTESVTVADLGEGRWYWRVKPAYLISEDIAIKSSAVSSFYIEKKKSLPPIELIAPGKTADTAKDKSLTFSWKNAQEVKTYALRIARSESMSDTVSEYRTDRNYFELQKAAQTLPNGIYYWTVEGLDEDNEVITSSNGSVFKTRDSEIILRSVFPPENYVLADTLCLDTRFTWKTNLNAEHLFQVSSSRDFSDLVVNQKVQGSSVEGLSLKQGEYYWRVFVKNDFEEFQTETKKLIVAAPFDKPELLGMGERVIIPPEAKNAFTWTPVSGVDYYQLKIMIPDSDSEPLYENAFITKNDISIPLQSIADGNYVINVQGFAGATLTSSRRYSYADSRRFELKHLRPAELLYPVQNAKINGVQAALQPGVLKWSSVDKPVNARLILEKNGRRRAVLSVANPGFSVQLPPLEAGTYRWRISAATESGLDISSVKDGVFTVLPIEPLEKTAVVFPADKEVLGVPFFKTNRSIVFKWEKVRDATHYNLCLYNAKKQKLFEREIGAADNSFEFTELSVLARGDFYIEVRALRRLENGMLFQDGRVSACRFTIDLPKPAKVKTNDAGVMYGR
ncbi:FecR family protein [Treponema sp. HNW]|uniref:FecR domain-containing protein n=1 Tax=Treponema sp. HNW TaxID=3116654 RepID=UPI003D0C003A